MSQIYDLAIIGGGPAGVAGGVYASRKRLKTVFITDTFDSQSSTSEEIQNWIGTPKISGADLTKNLENHLQTYADNVLDIKTKERGESITKVADGFEVKTNKGSHQAKTVLITTGASRKKLETLGADKFEGKGLTYCATCDGPMFTDQDVIVVGGGNAAFESAAQLAAYCKSVTLVQRSRRYRAEQITVDKVLANPKVKSITNVAILEIVGDKFVSGMKVQDKETGQETLLNASGIFVEIGHIPATDLIKSIANLNEVGSVIVDAKTQRTSCAGLWAAGDCTDGLYAQNNIAVGDAVKAIEDIYRFLKN
jgi:alkyl hydroperoxide reductase subunit F